MLLQKIRPWIPLFFWIFQVIVHIIRNIYLIISNSFASIFSNVIIIFPLDAVTFSVFYYYFAPRYFKRKNFNLNILLSFVYIFIYGFVWVFVYYFWQTTNYDDLKSIYFSSFGHSINYSFFGILVRLGIDWFEKREKEKDLEKQNIKTELALLRAQINPHFLFNTLNNINSFANQNSEKTSYAIIKLSEIMRYMLYEANGEKVLLDKEIQYIYNFLDLQKLRYRNTEFIKFEVIGNTSNIFIPPMLFIPFIENAFKHSKKSESDPIIIKLSVTNKEMNFICTNVKRQLSESEKKLSNGIGIQNINRRLDYLYPDNFYLDIKEDEKTYSVYLKIMDYEN